MQRETLLSTDLALASVENSNKLSQAGLTVTYNQTAVQKACRESKPPTTLIINIGDTGYSITGFPTGLFPVQYLPDDTFNYHNGQFHMNVLPAMSTKVFLLL